MKLALCLFKYFPYGGLQRDFVKVARECLERNFSVDVYVMQWQGEKIEGLNIIEVKCRGLTNHRRAKNFAKLVQKKLRLNNYDKVIGFNKMPGLDFYFAGDGCFKARGKKKLHAWHKISPRYKTFSQLEQAVFAPEQDCNIFVLNEKSKNQYMECYRTPHERFHLVPPGISEDRVICTDAELIAQELRDDWVIGKTDIMLLSIASDFNTKGLIRSFYAIAALPDVIKKKVVFCIIGEDNNEPYLQLAQKLKLRDRIIFTGARDDVGRFLMAADLLLHPALTENAGLVIVEALACGLPVLVTDICGYACHVERARAGIVMASPFSQVEYNHHLYELLKTNYRKTYGKNALEYIAKIDIFSMAQEVVNKIEQSVA